VSAGADARAETLRLLQRWRAPSAHQEALREEYVAFLRAYPDALLRSGRPDHLTASVLVVSPDAERVLLTLHAKAGAWFQLGGHLEPSDTDVVAAATREGREESGLGSLQVDPVPVHLDVHPVPFCGAGVRHLDVRFVAVTHDERGHRAGAESSDLRWWPVDDLPGGTDLAELVGLARARVLSR
jgi:8-oxo-dGTP pyrophosphatase MutT (NUDIX family)